LATRLSPQFFKKIDVGSFIRKKEFNLRIELHIEDYGIVSEVVSAGRP
jgi:hypothetical protein